jgi:hypothetical protein
VQIKQLECLIKNYYNIKKTESAKIRSRVKWAEEGAGPRKVMV